MSQEGEEKKNPLDIIILLDCSSSMDVMGQEPAQALNLFLKEQKKLDENSRVTLYEFNSEIKVPLKNVPLKDVQPYENFSCSGLTCLYDCIVRAITEAEKNRNTIFVVITDGMNTIGNTPREDAYRLIREHSEKYNWQAIFLAANIDATENGTALSIEPNRCASFSQNPGNFTKAMRALSNDVSLFREASQTQQTPSLILDGNTSAVLTAFAHPYHESTQENFLEFSGSPMSPDSPPLLRVPKAPNFSPDSDGEI